MDSTYASIIADYDLGAMRDRLNKACNGEALSLPETQEIRQMVERMAHVQLDGEIDAFVRRQRASCI